MCGRFCLTCEPVELEEEFKVEWPGTFTPLQELFPSDLIPALLIDPATGKPVIRMLKWGLIPHWAKEEKIGRKMFNARMETAYAKPSFRDAWRCRRCLIPASGFWEWQKTLLGKEKYFFTPDDSSHYAFAGLWETWQPTGTDSPVLSATILTTAAEGEIAEIHDRMPVILPKNQWRDWLLNDFSPES